MTTESEWERVDALAAASRLRSPVNQKRVRFIYKAIPAGASVLEIGAGTGMLLEPLVAAGHHVVAVDVEACEVAGVEFHVGDALTFDAGRTFDAVIASEVIEHVVDPAGLLAVARRHLREGGVLLLTTPNGYGPYELRHNRLNPRSRAKRSNRLRRLLGREPYVWGSGPDHAQWFALPRLRGLIEDAGFVVEEVRNSNGLAGAWLWKLPERVRAADVRLADRLPHWAASGWFIRARAS